MPAPYLSPDLSLEEFREELVFLAHRLSKEKTAADLRKLVVALLDQWPKLHAQQLALADAQTVAQGDVTFADETLDARVDAFDNDARHAVGGDRADPRYRLYFVTNASDLKRPVLGDELDTLRDWLEHLQSEELAPLRAHARPLAAELAAADAAVKARDGADAQNKNFRATGDRAKYVQKVMATRDRVWAELDGRRAKMPAGTPRDRANGFFRPRHATPPTPEEIKARADAREQRRALAQQRKDAAAKLREAQQAVSALKKTKKKPA